MMRVSIAHDSADKNLVFSSDDALTDQRVSDCFIRLHSAVNTSDRGDALTPVNGGDSGNASGILPTSEAATGGNTSSLSSSLGMPAVVVDPFIPYSDAMDDTAPASSDQADSYTDGAFSTQPKLFIPGVN